MIGIVLATVISACSPDGKNVISLDDASGRLLYSVDRSGSAVVAPSEIGLAIKGHPFQGRILSSKEFVRSGMLKTPIYRKAEISLAAKGVRAELGGGYAVEMIARDDGVAYRFVTSFADEKVRVMAETADVNFSSGDLSVWAGYPQLFGGDPKASYLSNWESVYTNVTAEVAGKKTDRFAELPMVVETGWETVLSISESDQRDYPGWLLRGSGESAKLKGDFAPEPIEEKCTGPYHIATVTRHDYLAETAGTRTYPWRVFMLADRAVDLVNSDAVYALAEPCRLADTSWIRPGLAQWEWWHRWNLTGVPFRAGINTATYLHYIDFASESGVPYLIMDGGWSKDYALMNAIPQLDLKAVVRHAVEKNVGIILWMPWASILGREEETCRVYSELGVKGFKLDGICRNDHFLTHYLENTARIAAKYHLVIDYHGVSKPSGLSRTYPNVLTYEGVHGLENTKWEGSWMPRCDFPQNDLTSFFCRMTAGAMDYTPGAMRNMAANEYRYSDAEPGSCGTRTRQLALYTLFESPLQMLCDSPSLYRANRDCFDFLRKMPTVWDETVPLDGVIGRFAAIARRSGETWYVAAITDWQAKKTAIDTDFLKSGVWTAEIFADGANADRDATDYTHTTQTVRAGESFAVRLQPGGGWTAKLTRAVR